MEREEQKQPKNHQLFYLLLSPHDLATMPPCLLPTIIPSTLLTTMTTKFTVSTSTSSCLEIPPLITNRLTRRIITTRQLRSRHVRIIRHALAARCGADVTRAVQPEGLGGEDAGFEREAGRGWRLVGSRKKGEEGGRREDRHTMQCIDLRRVRRTIVERLRSLELARCDLICVCESWTG